MPEAAPMSMPQEMPSSSPSIVIEAGPEEAVVVVPENCRYCGKRLRIKSNLEKHEKEHEGKIQ